MSAELAPVDHSNRVRRWWLPLIAAAVPVALRGLLAVMNRYEIGLEFLFPVMMAFQFSAVLAGLVIGVWFLFFAGFSTFTRVSVSIAALALIATGFATVRKVEFDGQMTPRLWFRWEPSEEQLLGEHLAGAAKATGATDLTVGPSDSPAFRGPAGDGVTPGVTLAEWAAPPKVLWKHPVGGGHAGIAVAGNSAVTVEQRGDQEVIVCYDRATGRERWAFGYPARFRQSEPMGGDGPRTTPAVVGGLVYSLGGAGELVCLDGATGKPQWQVNVIADNGAVPAEWGVSGSPLVVGERVFVNPGVNPADNTGQAVAAYDRLTGKKLWAAGRHPAAYASPLRATFAGVEQVLVFDAAGLGAHDPATGAELWRFPWKTDMGMNSAQPVLLPGDRVFVSSERSNGGAVVEVTKAGEKWQAKEVWRTRSLSARFCCPVFTAGHLYGLSEGRLVCVDAATGKRKWAEGDFGNGQIVLAGDKLVVTGEKGKVSLVAADPAEFRELGSVPLFDARTWNVPALAGKQLFARNHREMACLELP